MAQRDCSASRELTCLRIATRWRPTPLRLFANGMPLPPYGVGEGLPMVGCGVAVEEGIQVPSPVRACCRAAVPRLLRTAKPIAD